MNQADYICKMLNISRPKHLTEDIWSVVNKCDSKLEQMFLIGALNFITNGVLDREPPRSDYVSYCDQKIECIAFPEPWENFNNEMLPCHSFIAIAPQIPFNKNKYHHDFGFFVSNNRDGSDISLKCAIEIDGYGVHKNRRAIDAYRDSLTSYPVMRFYEETANPKNWIKEVYEVEPCHK